MIKLSSSLLDNNLSSFSSQNSQNAIVYELMASPSTTSTKSDGNESGDKSSSDDNEVQAVCCSEIGSSLWFAVSRAEKTLSLYCIPAANVLQNNIGGDSTEMMTRSIYPSAIYTLPKRARCLAITNVDDDCHIIITGDLSGDAIAFPIPNDASPSASNENEAVSVKPVSSPKRLLLGHTASMLTGLSVVRSKDQQQFILTADRDEKVRVSRFPETHIIQGYLLGHSSFISCMDAISHERSLCLTASGDGTSRLYDYQTCKELGMLPVIIKKASETKQDEMDDCENDEVESSAQEDENDMDNEGDSEEVDLIDFDEEEDFEEEDESWDRHTVAVPLSVSLHPDAKYAAVSRDEIQSIDIHPIPPVAVKSSSSTSLQLSHLISLHKKQTLECNSQPLAVRFTSDSLLVLATEPEYLLHFSTNETTPANDVSFHDISESSCLTKALRNVAQSENITMPRTTLERGDKLQKKEDRKELTVKNMERGGLHWNDPGRKVTAKLAQQRKRQRKKARRHGKGEEANEGVSKN